MENVIVLGCPRSGTTFLMRLLNTIEDAECLTGTVLPVAIPHVVNQPLAPEVYDALCIGFERAIDAYVHSGRLQSRLDAVRKWRLASGTPARFVKALRGSREVNRMIFKEPFLSLAPKFVRDSFPEAKIVHIYRDGRDCANSLIRTYDVLSDDQLKHMRGSEMRIGRKYDERYVPWWVDPSREDEFMGLTAYARAAWMWAYMVRKCCDNFGGPDDTQDDSVMLIRYEDLMSSPAEVGLRLFDFIGVEPGRKSHKVLSQAHAKSIGNYKRRDSREIDEANRVAGLELALYGYNT